MHTAVDTRQSVKNSTPGASARDLKEQNKSGGGLTTREMVIAFIVGGVFGILLNMACNQLIDKVNTLKVRLKLESYSHTLKWQTHMILRRYRLRRRQNDHSRDIEGNSVNTNSIELRLRPAIVKPQPIRPVALTRHITFEDLPSCVQEAEYDEVPFA